MKGSMFHVLCSMFSKPRTRQFYVQGSKFRNTLNIEHRTLNSLYFPLLSALSSLLFSRSRFTLHALRFTASQALNVEPRTLNILFALCLLVSVTASAQTVPETKNQGEKVYMVNDYRYVPASEADDKDTGLSLCGTRCNALSTDYLNVTEVGGWKMMKNALNQELRMELNSPFLKGHCICIVDEYLVSKDDRFSDERRRSRAEK